MILQFDFFQVFTEQFWKESTTVYHEHNSFERLIYTTLTSSSLEMYKAQPIIYFFNNSFVSVSLNKIHLISPWELKNIEKRNATFSFLWSLALIKTNIPDG